jgi:hypothetical protein
MLIVFLFSKGRYRQNEEIFPCLLNAPNERTTVVPRTIIDLFWINKYN